MTIEGLDVSRWQSTTPNLTGKAFLIPRAVYGIYPDPMYDTHIANATADGLVTAAYAFGRSVDPVADQVRAFLAEAHAQHIAVLDLERDGTSSMTFAQARDWISRIKATGRTTVLYHSASGFPSLGQDLDWIAKWSTTPPSAGWAFWQYSGTGIDRDRFNGSVAALRALAQPVHPVTHHLSFSTGAFWVYTTDGKPFTDSRGVHYGGRITGRVSRRFSAPTGAPCTGLAWYARTGMPSKRMAKVTAGVLAGKFVAVPQSAVTMETT